MLAERDLDFYVSTPDEHFNHNAQFFYFKFFKKIENSKSFRVYVKYNL